MLRRVRDQQVEVNGCHYLVTGVEQSNVEADGIVVAALQLNGVRHPTRTVCIRGLHFAVGIVPYAVEPSLPTYVRHGARKELE